MAVNPRGRPPALSADDKDLLLEYIASGMGNTQACHMMRIEPSTFYLTLNRDADFMEKYQAAKAGAVEAYVDEAEEAARKAPSAATGAEVAGIKVFADFKKWQAARLAPNRWGEKSTMHVTGQVSEDPQELAKRLAFLQRIEKGPANAEPNGDDDEVLV